MIRVWLYRSSAAVTLPYLDLPVKQRADLCCHALAHHFVGNRAFDVFAHERHYHDVELPLPPVWSAQDTVTVLRDLHEIDTKLENLLAWRSGGVHAVPAEIREIPEHVYWIRERPYRFKVTKDAELKTPRIKSVLDFNQSTKPVLGNVMLHPDEKKVDWPRTLYGRDYAVLTDRHGHIVFVQRMTYRPQRLITHGDEDKSVSHLFLAHAAAICIRYVEDDEPEVYLMRYGSYPQMLRRRIVHYYSDPDGPDFIPGVEIPPLSSLDEEKLLRVFEALRESLDIIDSRYVRTPEPKRLPSISTLERKGKTIRRVRLRLRTRREQ